MVRSIWLALGGLLGIAVALVVIIIICCICAGAFYVMHRHGAPGAT